MYDKLINWYGSACVKLFQWALKLIGMILVKIKDDFLKLSTNTKIVIILCFLLTGYLSKINPKFLVAFPVFILFCIVKNIGIAIKEIAIKRKRIYLNKKYKGLKNIIGEKIEILDLDSSEMKINSYVPLEEIQKKHAKIEHFLNRKIISFKQDSKNLRLITFVFVQKSKFKQKYFLKDYIDLPIPKGMELPFLLGIDTNEKPVFADLAAALHLLIVGETGGGKSTIINSTLISLMHYNSNILYCMVDYKWVELKIYNDLNNVIFIEEENVVNFILEDLTKELLRRKKIITGAGWQNIKQYNKSEPEKLCYIVFLVDEIADLRLNGKKAEIEQVENKLVRVINQGRAFGIITILATQRPSYDQMNTNIRGGIPCKISFKVGKENRKQEVTGIRGVENLDKGEFVYRDELGKDTKLKGFYTDRREEWSLFNNLLKTLGGGNNVNKKIIDLSKRKK